MSKLIDLGHVISDGMRAYPGLPPARVSQLLTHEASRPHYEHRAEFSLTKLEIAGNTGTYLDSPWHRHADRFEISTIPIERVACLPGVVIDSNPTAQGRDIDLEFAPEVVGGAAVLIRTGWSRHWGSERYWLEGPYISTGFIDRLVEARPALIGVDFSNVDDPADPERPAHTRLLDAEILIVEHMCHLERLPVGDFTFHCAPLRVKGAASIPVRPYAVLAAARGSGGP